MKKPCENCGRGPYDRPAIFQNERWCSDLCRKAVLKSDE